VASDDWQRLPLESTFKIEISAENEIDSDLSGDYSDEMLEGEIFQGKAGEKNLKT